MFDELAAVGCGNAFLDLVKEPVLITEHALDSLDYERLTFAPLRGGGALKLFLKLRIESDFHKLSLVGEKHSVNLPVRLPTVRFRAKRFLQLHYWCDRNPNANTHNDLPVALLSKLVPY